MFAALEDALGVKISRLSVDPQITGALGAAVMAWETAGGSS